MNISQLECFLSVANHLSFARAAEELSISQPAVTHQIQSLEDELGGKLLLRTTKTVALTEEGKVFAEDAKRILAIARNAEERFRNPKPKEFKPFNIGYIHGLNPDFILHAIKEISGKYSSLHPSVFAISAAELTMRTADGSLDAAIGFKDTAYRKGDLKYKELCKTDLSYVYANSPSDSPSPTPEEIAKMPLIFWESESVLSEIDKVQKSFTAKKEPEELFFCNSVEAASAMVKAGFGFSIMPEVFAESGANMLKYEGEGENSFSLGVYYRSSDNDKILSDLVKALKKFMQ